MPLRIPSEGFCGGFGISDEDEKIERVEEDKQESLLTQMLIDAGVTWSPRGVAKALMARGVRVIKL